MKEKEINEQVENFVKFVGSGWNTELAFDVCYDMICDLIDAEKFLNLCQRAVEGKK